VDQTFLNPPVMRKIIWSSVVVLIIVLVACSKSSDDDGGNTITCDATVKTFSGDVNPIIQSFCNQPSCHASGSTNGPGPLTNYTQVFNARSLIRSAVASGFMPQNATLTEWQKMVVVCWIDSGAPNN
jgi:hypothetical protein